jgi:tetratricopeptide (TPR) repeat protein
MRFAIVLLIALAACSFPAQADDAEDWPLCDGSNSGGAIAACTRILQRGESDQSGTAIAYNNRGTSHSKRGEYDKAIADLSEALSFDPRMPTAYITRGSAHNNKGEYDRAIADLDQALQLNPQLDTAYNNRGFAYNNKGEYDRAIADLDRALRLNPQNASAYNNRGLAYSNKGDYDRAIADLSLALSPDPQMIAAYDNRGYAYKSKGEYGRALADYDEAINLQSDDAGLYNARGNVYYSQGDYDLALVDYNRALKLKPDFAVVFSNAGDARLVRGEHDRAIADYDKAISLKSNDGGFYEKRAQAHYAKGDYDRAIIDETRAIELNPANGIAFNNRSASFNLKGDYERAIADATRAIELIPQSANPYRHRGAAYFKSGKIDLARADLTRALELKPDYQEAKTTLAELEQAEVSTKATPSAHTEKEQVATEAKSALAAPLPRPSAFPSGKRVALVIGNSNYRSVARLANPANDAKLMANALKSLGFELIGGGAQLDLDKAGFEAAVQSFGTQLQGADVGLFYYAGHGLGLRGTNYLVPVTANPTREADLDFQMVDVEVALHQMEASGTKLNVVILDACRNDPFAGEAYGREAAASPRCRPLKARSFLMPPSQAVLRKTAPTVTAPIARRLPRPSASRASTSSSPSTGSVWS